MQPLRRPRRWRGRWLVLMALGALATGLLVEAGRSLADDGRPLQPVPGGGDGSILAVTGEIGRDSYGIYLVDLSNQTICVYQYQTAQKTLKLLAARTFAYDTQLDEYNSEPSPRQIREMVTAHRRLTEEPASLAPPTDAAAPAEPNKPEVGPEE